MEYVKSIPIEYATMLVKCLVINHHEAKIIGALKANDCQDYTSLAKDLSFSEHTFSKLVESLCHKGLIWYDQASSKLLLNRPALVALEKQTFVRAKAGYYDHKLGINQGQKRKRRYCRQFTPEEIDAKWALIEAELCPEASSAASQPDGSTSSYLAIHANAGTDLCANAAHVGTTVYSGGTFATMDVSRCDQEKLHKLFRQNKIIPGINHEHDRHILSLHLNWTVPQGAGKKITQTQRMLLAGLQELHQATKQELCYFLNIPPKRFNKGIVPLIAFQKVWKRGSQYILCDALSAAERYELEHAKPAVTLELPPNFRRGPDGAIQPTAALSQADHEPSNSVTTAAAVTPAPHAETISPAAHAETIAPASTAVATAASKTESTVPAADATTAVAADAAVADTATKAESATSGATATAVTTVKGASLEMAALEETQPEGTQAKEARPEKGKTEVAQDEVGLSLSS